MPRKNSANKKKKESDADMWDLIELRALVNEQNAVITKLTTELRAIKLKNNRNTLVLNELTKLIQLDVTGRSRNVHYDEYGKQLFSDVELGAMYVALEMRFGKMAKMYKMNYVCERLARRDPDKLSEIFEE